MPRAKNPRHYKRFLLVALMQASTKIYIAVKLYNKTSRIQMKQETKKQFEERYIKDSGITKEFYKEHKTTMPCKCDYEHCPGWAAVSKGCEKDHDLFYTY